MLVEFHNTFIDLSQIVCIGEMCYQQERLPEFNVHGEPMGKGNIESFFFCVSLRSGKDLLYEFTAGGCEEKRLELVDLYNNWQDKVVFSEKKGEK